MNPSREVPARNRSNRQELAQGFADVAQHEGGTEWRCQPVMITPDTACED